MCSAPAASASVTSRDFNTAAAAAVAIAGEQRSGIYAVLLKKNLISCPG